MSKIITKQRMRIKLKGWIFDINYSTTNQLKHSYYRTINTVIETDSILLHFIMEFVHHWLNCNMGSVSFP